jgi:hypothetical protein
MMSLRSLDLASVEGVAGRPSWGPGEQSRWQRFWEIATDYVLAAVLVVAALAAIVSLAVQMPSILEGDDLSGAARGNVMLTSQVVREILDNESMIWVDDAIDENTTISTPAGTFKGPGGARAFASLLAGGEPDRAFDLFFVAANGDQVELDWRIAGPLSPGIVKGEFVGEGSYVGGRAIATVMNGSVQELRFLVED